MSASDNCERCKRLAAELESRNQQLARLQEAHNALTLKSPQGVEIGARVKADGRDG